jgi:NADPH:quinone reductase
LVGTWQVTGGASGQVTYRRLEGGSFLAQDFDLEQEGQRVKGLELIGREREFGAEQPSRDIRSRIYDSQGNTFSYVYELEGDTLTIWAGEKGSPAYTGHLQSRREHPCRRVGLSRWRWPCIDHDQGHLTSPAAVRMWPEPGRPVGESGVMRALVVEQPGGLDSMRMRQLPVPQPGPDQVVVAVEAVGVNPVDAGNRADPSWAGIRPPYVVGYELAGRIQAVGEGGAGWSRGDLVWGLLPVRGTRWGTYAELVAVDAALVGPRPPSLSAVEAASLPLAGATAIQLLDRLDPKPGEWVLVHGAAGGVGSLFVQLAQARGARVIASASAQREALLRDLGVEVFLDRHDGDVAGRACRAVGRELDMVADLVGGGVLAASLPVVREGGRAGSIVELAGDLELAVDRNITLHGVLMRPSQQALGVLAAAVASGSLRPVVDQVLDFADAAAAHRRVESRRGQGKVVLRVAG